MNRKEIEAILKAVQSGESTVSDSLKRLARIEGDQLEDATIDHQRSLRCGFPEVIFGQNKTTDQILRIAASLVGVGSTLLATRLSPESMTALSEAYPEGQAVHEARLFYLSSEEELPPASPVAVVSAGTSDMPVAEEAAWTLVAMGVPVRRLRDVGVAGLHRILQHQETLREVAALVVVAGMEGALPSVVGGLTDRPIIAVPTSVGYGTNLGGLTPLMAMLTSCSAGVSVVNIDNGFGAGYSAALIARLAGASNEIKEESGSEWV